MFKIYYSCFSSISLMLHKLHHNINSPSSSKILNISWWERLSNTALHCFDDSLNADIKYLDFSKAFNRVNHNKSTKTGIGGKLLQWIRYFLTNRIQYVVIDDIHSRPAKIISGVLQGTVLGALLFIVYINDIADSLNIVPLKYLQMTLSPRKSLRDHLIERCFNQICAQ